MKRVIIISFFLMFSIFLSSCSYDFHNVYKENVRWTSHDNIFEFDIQGPFNEKYGYGKLKVNNEFINVSIIISLDVGPAMIYVHTFEDYDNPILELSIDVRSGTSLDLSVHYNNTSDTVYDDRKLTINRTDLSEEEMDANKYLYTNFVNEEYGLHINGGYLTPISRSGKINYNNKFLDIRIDYLDDYNYEIYDINDNLMLFSGQYVTSKEYVELLLNSNDFYPSSLSSIKLELVEPFV